MEARSKRSPLPWLKPAVLTGSFIPIAAILERAWRDNLGPNPIAQALNQLGLIALVFLVAALGCTPLENHLRLDIGRCVSGGCSVCSLSSTLCSTSSPIRCRSGCDRLERNRQQYYKANLCFLGFSTFVLLIPLAATSTNSALRRLGYVR